MSENIDVEERVKKIHDAHPMVQTKSIQLPYYPETLLVVPGLLTTRNVAKTTVKIESCLLCSS